MTEREITENGRGRVGSSSFQGVERVANCHRARLRRVITGLNFLYKSRNGPRMCRFHENGRKKTNEGCKRWEETDGGSTKNIMDINVARMLMRFAIPVSSSSIPYHPNFLLFSLPLSEIYLRVYFSGRLHFSTPFQLFFSLDLQFHSFL